MRDFLVTASLLTSLATASIADPVELVAQVLNETLRPAAKISGTTVVGVTYLTQAQSPDFRLGATLPPSWAGQDICVRMISADGLYESQNTYRVAADWAGGSVALPYPTAHPAKLSALEDDELAVLTSPGGCDVRKGAAFLPTALRQTANWRQDRVRLFVNAFHADEVYLYVGDDPAAPPVDCEKSGATAKVAFDFICEIALTGQAPAVSVEINRVAGGQVAPPDLIVIGQIEP